MFGACWTPRHSDWRKGSEDLFLRPGSAGLLLRRQPRELLRPVVPAHADDADLDSRTEFAGSQAAIHSALTALLRSAGTRSPSRPPTGCG
ncbi:hypothetical protein [Streptomyces sp. NPDC051000]|uniref:hypothetical protein n=1 Tax=Streptomyces sp. NPDC051000 TaxID=3155520 RepID=UPI0033C9A136